MTFTPDESKSMVRAALEGCSTASLEQIADVIAARLVVAPRETLHAVTKDEPTKSFEVDGNLYCFPNETPQDLYNRVTDLLSIADFLAAGGDDDARLEREALALYNASNSSTGRPPADSLPITWREHWRGIAREARRVHGIEADGRQATDPILHDQP